MRWMLYEVFVSHSAKDKLAADALVAHLERAGLRCWVAPRDILPGASWASSIVEAINHSRAMVVIFSENANTSDHVRREVERAVFHRIPILPLRIDATFPKGDLEYFLSTAHWMDAMTPPIERHFADFAAKVGAVLDIHVPPPPVAPAEPPSKAAEPARQAERLAQAAQKSARLAAHARTVFLPAAWGKLRALGKACLAIAWQAEPPPPATAGGTPAAEGSNAPAPREARGRTILRTFINFTFGILALTGAVTLTVLAIGDVLKRGAKAEMFGHEGPLMGFIIALFLTIVWCAFASWRWRKPWAIGGLVALSMLLQIAVGLAMAFDRLRHFGNHYLEEYFMPWVYSPVYLLLCGIPLIATLILVVLEHEPEAPWWRALWRPFTAKRPPWLLWWRRGLMAFAGFFLIVGSISALVAEIASRTPLEYGERDYARGSWKVTDSGHYYYSMCEDGMVWTFSRDRVLRVGRVNASTNSYEGWPDLQRWHIEGPAFGEKVLVLEFTEDGRPYQKFRVKGPDKDSSGGEKLTLSELSEEPTKVFVLTRVPRVPFRKEEL